MFSGGRERVHWDKLIAVREISDDNSHYKQAREKAH